MFLACKYQFYLGIIIYFIMDWNRMWRGMWSEAEPQDLEENSHQKTTTMLKVVESTDLVQFRDITLDQTDSVITLY